MSIIAHDAPSVNSVTSRKLFGHPIRIGNKVSGFFLEPERQYYRKVDGSRHFLRKPPAITNDMAALAEAERLGADRVRIVDSETGIEYTCIIPIIHEYGFTLNRGWGEQIALPFAYWIKTTPDGTVTPPRLPNQPKPKSEIVQGALFDFSEQRRGGAY